MKKVQFSIRFRQLACLAAVLLSLAGCSAGDASQPEPVDLTQYSEAYDEYKFRDYPCKYDLLRFSEALPGGFTAVSADGNEYTFIKARPMQSDYLMYNAPIYVRYQEVEQENGELLRYAVRLEELYPQITATLIQDTRSVGERLISGPHFWAVTDQGDMLEFQTGYGLSFKERGIEYGDRIHITYSEIYDEDLPPELSRFFAQSVTKIPD